MRFDLKKPCKNCPFSKSEHRIVFANRERAEEIEEQAYRRGFPCHLSAECVENDDGEGGFVPVANTQHCAGALIMYLNDGETEWPGIDNDYKLAAKLERQTRGNHHLCFDGVEAFLSANTPRQVRPRKRRKKKP